jgi:hypothetical protein
MSNSVPSPAAQAAPDRSHSMGVVPALYRPRQLSAVAPATTRLLALGLATGCLAVLIVAASLTPSPTGVGSHRGLGLQGCQLLDRTGIPCPSCGMTTSFTWFAHGNLLASLYVQPMGMALAVAAAGCVWGGYYVAVTGRPAHRLLTMIPARGFLVGVLAFAILAWGWKIFLRLRGLDGWG